MSAATDGPATPSTIGSGIAFMLVAVGIFTTMDALIKWLATAYPVLEIVFFRSVFAFIPLMPLIARGGSAAIRTQRPLGQAGRALTGLVATFGYFYCYRTMPLADVFGIAFAAPIFVTALSVPLLGERVGIRRWSAVAVGFLGVLIMVRPDTGIVGVSAWVALFATSLYALAQIFIRDLGKTDSTVCIVFYATLTMAIASAAAMPLLWVTPTLVDTIILIMIGVLGGLGQLAFTRAFRLAPASVVSPFDYTGIVYAGLIGYVVWHDVPTVTFLIGACVVIASGLYILHRETRLARIRP